MPFTKLKEHETDEELKARLQVLDPTPEGYVRVIAVDPVRQTAAWVDRELHEVVREAQMVVDQLVKGRPLPGETDVETRAKVTPETTKE